MRLSEVFDCQVQTLIQKGYSSQIGMSAAEFQQQLAPLQAHVEKLSNAEIAPKMGRLPFVIVVKTVWEKEVQTLPIVEREGQKCVISMSPLNPTNFNPIESVVIPNGMAYLLMDIDRGGATLNVHPVDALAIIHAANCSPLTIDEGIAILTHFPDFIQKNHCFSLLASRRNDRRVPALWLSAGKPKLGWCWNGNPHTWLGSASCGQRL